MKKVKLVFIILHYQTINMTKQCIAQLFKTFDMSEHFIIVVDNKSPNGTGKELEKIYAKNFNIKVILAYENLGFANGNNLGFDYAKANLDFDFLIIMNNDILIQQKNFEQKIYAIYKEKGFDVLGPDIFNLKTNLHQNPLNCTPCTLDRLKILKNETENKLKHIYFYMFYTNLIKKLKHIKPQSKYDFKKEFLNCVLHGSCLIYSKKFVTKRKYAFYPKTFMFYEEEILFYECNRENFKTFYSPDIQVLHFENATTDSLFKNIIKRKKWYYTEILKSLNVFIEYIGGGTKTIYFNVFPLFNLESYRK